MKRLLPVAVMAAASLAIPAAGQAAKAKPSATVIGPIVTHGKKADVKARYRCTEGDVLWVSVKQVGSAKKDKRLAKEGSSMLALKSGGAWLDSHRLKFTCDGKQHTQTFKVDTMERQTKDQQGNPVPASGKLKKGSAYFQFCLTKEPAAEGQEGELLISKSGFRKVK